jgi:ATP-dependent Lhr-like helicase
LNLPEAALATAFATLEAQGFALRGRFTGGWEEWCERRLLARIHRYTVKRLRAEIEPVQARDFLRFLFDWQHVSPDARLKGSDSVAALLGQLEGFEAPASAWETDVIPSRIPEYEPAWLDEHCRAGRFVWARLAPRGAASEKGAAPIRSTPIAFLARRSVRAWSAFAAPRDPEHVSSRAGSELDHLRVHGASYFDDIADQAHMLPVDVEEGLAELVALGMVNSDSFTGLRALLIPPNKRAAGHAGRRRRRLPLFGMADAGRWAVVRREPPAAAGEFDDADVEQVVRALLRRWGVIFWKLLAREAEWLPRWRSILACCRRLEARGDLRGGRFVAGFAGEQYALPEAVGLLRDVRRRAPAEQYVAVSGADPLNLVGILTPGARLPSLAGNRLLYQDGLPIAQLAGGEVSCREPLEPKQRWQAQNALLRRLPALLVGPA